MKKQILICIVIALISGVLGFLFGVNNSKMFNRIEGTYWTSSWNGKEAVLVLNKDYTCIYPTGDKGTWSVDENTLYLEIKTRYSYADGEIHTVESLNKHEATIVDQGIVLYSTFFQKLN